MKAKLISGTFHLGKERVYIKGDVIDDVEKVPVCFRNMWEPIPDRHTAPANKESAKIEQLPETTPALNVIEETPNLQEEVKKAPKKTTSTAKRTDKSTSKPKTKRIAPKTKRKTNDTPGSS